MSSAWARTWFGTTAACAIVGVAISAVTAGNNANGHFHPAAARAANAFAFFTIQSNLLVAIATLLLARRLQRSSTAFAVLRQSGLAAIIVTGIVFHAVLSQTLDLKSWAIVGNELVHTVVPVLAVVGWLLIGPRGLTSSRVAVFSLSFPIAWLAFTLIRGASVRWYPYPFIDVSRLGYGRVAVNCIWVAILMLAIAAGATTLDRRLGNPATRPT